MFCGGTTVDGVVIILMKITEPLQVFKTHPPFHIQQNLGFGPDPLPLGLAKNQLLLGKVRERSFSH